ncbi:unnamed protein product [Blepharisma stoltei]|uniref:Uncharacterized protein n=1 Tax=Blepharisma stoltei TaxID=1481888 RepID=A0AAU9KNH6_9CILI|nr:unnamed protein product [Blepharisma stoltei]
MGLLNYASLGIKLFTIATAIISFVLGATTIAGEVGYTSILVCIYLMLFSLIIICAEVSPYISGNYIARFFPFIESQLGKSLFMAVLASFCFGYEMGEYGFATGVLLFVSAALGVAISAVSRRSAQRESFKTQSQFYNDEDMYGS